MNKRIKERLLNGSKYFAKKHFRFSKQILQFQMINNNNKKKKRILNERKKSETYLSKKKKKENNGNI